jgi:hypothetical protein
MTRWMRQQAVGAAVVGCAAALLGQSAKAAVPKAWSDCAKEVAQYCPKATDDEAIFACIEKREELGVKSGLSKACYAAHERYEAQSGKEESEEHEKTEGHEAHEQHK